MSLIVWSNDSSCDSLGRLACWSVLSLSFLPHPKTEATTGRTYMLADYLSNYIQHPTQKVRCPDTNTNPF